MGYFSELDIWAKENKLQLVPTRNPQRRPIKFLYQTSRMQEPKELDTRIINGKVSLWPGCSVSPEWLSNCTDWTQVQNFDTKVKLI